MCTTEMLIEAAAIFQQCLRAETVHNVKVAWRALQFAGSHALLPLLIISFLITGIVRHPLMINVCITWIITGVISLLLVYARLDNDPLGTPICAAQASMIFATPPMCAAAMAALVHDVWRSTQNVNRQMVYRSSTVKFAAWVAMPHVTFVTFAVAGAIIALGHPENLTTRHYFYCAVPHGPYSMVTATATAAFLAVAMYYTVRIIWLIILNWVPLRKARLGAGCQLFWILRVVTVSTFEFIGFAFSLYTIVTPSVVPDMILATIPVIFGVLFFTSRDVWQTFLRKREPPKCIALVKVVTVEDVHKIALDLSPELPVRSPV